MEGVLAIIAIFVVLPWMIFHYVTKWKQQAPALTGADENLLDDMYETARRLEERLHTVERIVAADNPDFKPRRIGQSQDGDLTIASDDIETRTAELIAAAKQRGR